MPGQQPSAAGPASKGHYGGQFPGQRPQGWMVASPVQFSGGCREVEPALHPLCLHSIQAEPRTIQRSDRARTPSVSARAAMYPTPKAAHSQPSPAAPVAPENATQASSGT